MLQQFYLRMKFFNLYIFFFLFISTTVFSQKVIKHSVKSGESVYSIAKKYDVTEKEVYELNPKLKGSILGLKTVVQIPNKKYKKPVEKVAEKKEKLVKSAVSEEIVASKNDPISTHLVAPKETLYSISKKYGITMETICELNPELKTGTLKVGAKLKLPVKNAEIIAEKQPEKQIEKQIENKPEVKPVVTETVAKTPEVIVNSGSDVVHKVLPKETLYRISKNYGVSIAELQTLNPSIVSGLPIGYDLIIRKGNDTNAVAKSGNDVVVKNDTNTASEVIAVKEIPVGNLAKAEYLISKASENLGTRYRSGGTTAAGFDCSGLMYTTFKNIDMTLPRSSHEMANYGVKIDRSRAQKGDLIFFATFGRGRVSHVGMVTEVVDDEIKFIHSSTSSGVIISSTKENYYARSFVQVNRIIME